MTHFQKFMSFFQAPNVFQLFGDSKDLPPMILVDPEPSELVRLNALGYGIFITVNKSNGGRKAKDIEAVRYVFADLDGVSPARMIDFMPTFAVKSSDGKYHGYWATDSEFPLKGFRGVQKAIAYCFGSDPAVNDLPRVMRVAGFMHQKKEPQRTEVVWVNDDQSKLSYADCVEKFPPKPVKKWSSKSYSKGTSVGGFPQPDENIESILQRVGWTFLHGNRWRRPGKDHGGCSGEISEDGKLVCYTSSTTLEPMKAHDRADLVIAYDYLGNVKEYIKAIKNV